MYFEETPFFLRNTDGKAWKYLQYLANLRFESRSHRHLLGNTLFLANVRDFTLRFCNATVKVAQRGECSAGFR